jgi:hypothetical protein
MSNTLIISFFLYDLPMHEFLISGSSKTSSISSSLFYVINDQNLIKLSLLKIKSSYCFLALDDFHNASIINFYTAKLGCAKY